MDIIEQVSLDSAHSSRLRSSFSGPGSSSGTGVVTRRIVCSSPPGPVDLDEDVSESQDPAHGPEYERLKEFSETVSHNLNSPKPSHQNEILEMKISPDTLNMKSMEVDALFRSSVSGMSRKEL